MPPISHRPLTPRSMASDKTYYLVILPAMVVAVFLAAMLWSYIRPKWKRRRVPRSNRSRHDQGSDHSTQYPQSIHGARFPYVFPPHPAVVVLHEASSRLGDKPSIKYNTVPIPVYDPRVQSPFPKLPTPEPSEVTPRSLANRPIVIPPRRMPYLYAGGLPLRGPKSSPERASSKKYLTGNSSEELVLVTKCAGEQLSRPDSAHLASGRDIYSAHNELSPVGSGFTVKGFQERLAGGDDTARKQKVLPASMRNHHQGLDEWSTPTRSMPPVQNHFETPSSLGTSMSACGSSPYYSRKFSTPLTAPNLSLDQIPGATVSCGNISKLVPCRRLKGPFISSGSKKESHLVCQQPSSPAVTPERVSSGQTVQIGYRPISSKVPGKETSPSDLNLSPTTADPVAQTPTQNVQGAIENAVAEGSIAVDVRYVLQSRLPMAKYPSSQC